MINLTNQNHRIIFVFIYGLVTKNKLYVYIFSIRKYLFNYNFIVG